VTIFKGYCRVCSCAHDKYGAHMKWVTRHGDGGTQSFLSDCECYEFVPPDNLDYIEWLAAKRGLV
jgi:hypothetical protein